MKKIKVRWNNVFKFFGTIFCIILVFILLYYIINHHSEFVRVKKLINDIQNKVILKNIVDDENTTVIAPNDDISKFSNYWNYIKLSLLKPDFNTLKNYNKNIVGWIQIKGTDINYPIVQNLENKDYYKEHTYNDLKSKIGAIYIENDIKELPQNTIILGNKVNYDILLSNLTQVLDNKWFNDEDNHIIKYATENYITLFQVFSVYKEKNMNSIKYSFESDTEYRDYLDLIITKSLYNFKTSVLPSDKIITISTNSSKENITIHGKLLKIRIN